MPLTSLGISHHLVTLEELSQLSRVGDQITANLTECPTLVGHVLLSTCNRFEIYFESDGFHAGLDAVLTIVRDALPVQTRDLADRLQIQVGQGAVQHLLEVASGLDSMVLGEDEIIGQVRDALGQAKHHLSPALQRLFSAALTTGRAVGTQANLGAAGRSLAAVGLDLVEARHFPTAGRTALVIGTGSYARVVVAALSRRGCDDLQIYSPTGRAEQFAATHPVTPVSAAEFLPALAKADLLVTCSAGDRPGPVVTAAELAAARGDGAVLPILDLSLGGNVEPEAAALLGVDLIDLEEIGAHAPAGQTAAVLAARDLVTRGVETFQHLESGRAATPAVVAIRAHVSQFIEREIESATRRYDPATAAAVERSLRRVANSLLHTPSLRAAELARCGGLEDYAHALHTLFGINVEADV